MPPVYPTTKQCSSQRATSSTEHAQVLQPTEYNLQYALSPSTAAHRVKPSIPMPYVLVLQLTECNLQLPYVLVLQLTSATFSMPYVLVLQLTR